MYLKDYLHTMYLKDYLHTMNFKDYPSTIQRISKVSSYYPKNFKGVLLLSKESQ